MKTLVFVFVFTFGSDDRAKPTPKPDRSKCPHVSLHSEPHYLGDMTPAIVCEKCGKEWSYPGTSYLDRRDPKALEQKRVYELMEKRFK
jgi:hypothetical protein